MPPTLDDELESDGPDLIPARAVVPIMDEQPHEDEEPSDDEDGDDDSESEEYFVEKILKHQFLKNGDLQYQIKWLGYNKKSDLTWEPLENLGNSQKLVNEYHASIGGKPKREPGTVGSTKKKGGKRTAADAFSGSPAVASNGTARKRGRKPNAGATNDAPPVGTARLPEGSWENHVVRITSIVESEEDTTGQNQKGGKTLLGLLLWTDGKRTQHNLDALKRKCPQKLLNYYESHLVFGLDKSQGTNKTEDEIESKDELMPEHDIDHEYKIDHEHEIEVEAEAGSEQMQEASHPSSAED